MEKCQNQVLKGIILQFSRLAKKHSNKKAAYQSQKFIIYLNL